jgi:hypothetical protein
MIYGMHPVDVMNVINDMINTMYIVQVMDLYDVNHGIYCFCCRSERLYNSSHEYVSSTHHERMPKPQYE